MKNAWKYENKIKRKGKRVLPAWGKRDFAKNPEENDKKFGIVKLASSEREKVFEKVLWKSQISTF